MSWKNSFKTETRKTQRFQKVSVRSFKKVEGEEIVTTTTAGCSGPSWYSNGPSVIYGPKAAQPSNVKRNQPRSIFAIIDNSGLRW